jgi:nucleoside 2-deoxyribosyltransferase
MKKIYLIGSLRNPEIPRIGNYLRELGFEVFDDWFAGGKIADDEWQAYEQLRGRPYDVALRGHAAQHVYNFDLEHINSSDIGLLALPAGKSGHLELGYMIGQGKYGYVLFDKEPERWDVMYNFATAVSFDLKHLGQLLGDHL